MRGNVTTSPAPSGSMPAMLESYEFETSDDAPNPVPSKAMLRTLGHDVGECRFPMGPTPHGLEAAAREVHARLVAARG